MGKPDTRRMADDAAALADRIAALLAGKGAAVQGAALAELTARWLAGHIVAGDDAATRELRDTMLAQQMLCIRALTAVNAAIMRTER